MTTGPRAGERVMEQTLTRIIEKGLFFTQMRSDRAFCGPARASLLTGYNTNNHGISSNEDADYYTLYREGFKQNRQNGAPAYFHGPWERDLAYQAGLPATSVPASAQPLGSTTSNRRASKARGDNTDDDLQALTGSLPTWLERAGVTCCLIGKYTNAYAGQATHPAKAGYNGIGYDIDVTTAAVSASSAWNASIGKAAGASPVVGLSNFYVPPGWKRWRGLVGTDANWGGGAQDHWNVRVLRYDGPNPADGDGIESQDWVFEPYANTLTTLSRVGSIATANFFQHGLEVGDEFHIDGTDEDPKWGGQTTAIVGGFTQTYEPVVRAVIDANRFTYQLAGTLPTATTAGGTPRCYPHKYYGEGVWAKEAQAFISSRRDNEPWFCYYAPDNPHYAQDSGGADAPSHEAEKKYLLTVPEADAFTFNGVPGWIADASGPCSFSSTAGSAGSTLRRTITSNRSRRDGTGPFRPGYVGRPVHDDTGFIPGGATCVSVAANGMSCVISADPTGTSATSFFTIGYETTLVSEVTTTRRQAWTRRQEMLASTDDTIGAFLDAAEARGWNDLTIILTNDNGWSQGEHNSVETVESQWISKLMLWEGSCRSILAIHRASWRVNGLQYHFPVSHYDLPATILDMFAESAPQAGLASHHCHDKRDGVSILRLLTNPAAASTRAQALHRGYMETGLPTVGAQAEGIVVGTRKFVRKLDSSIKHLFDVANDGFTGYDDYDQTDLIPTHSAEATALEARLNVQRDGRWVPASNTNTFRSA